MSSSRLPDKNGLPSRLVLPSLVISAFATTPAGILTGLLLIDIGLAFGCSVGLMGQILTASSGAAFISALLMGVLSVRFRHKSLLLAGLSFISLSALGCSFASDLGIMLLFCAISGVGGSMVGPMNFALVAEHFPLERRTSAIGWLSAGLSLSFVIGAPAIGFIAELSGWRLAFLGYVLPISIASLMLVAKCLPSTTHSRTPTTDEKDYFAGFTAVLSNRSAVACMTGMATALAAYQAFLAYSSSFYRQRFLASTTVASLIVLVSALCFTLGSLVCSRFVKKLGRKTLAVSAAIIGSIFIILHTNLPSLWLSLTARFLGSLFMALANTAIGSLTLEQVPGFRGTMMSVNRAVSSVGSTLGAGLGGLVLLLYDYEFEGIALGSIGLAGAVILQLLAIDPTPRSISDEIS